jgi:hypothetical protein
MRPIRWLRLFLRVRIWLLRCIMTEGICRFSTLPSDRSKLPNNLLSVGRQISPNQSKGLLARRQRSFWASRTGLIPGICYSIDLHRWPDLRFSSKSNHAGCLTAGEGLQEWTQSVGMRRGTLSPPMLK